MHFSKVRETSQSFAAFVSGLHYATRIKGLFLSYSFSIEIGWRSDYPKLYHHRTFLPKSHQLFHSETKILQFKGIVHPKMLI